MSFNRKNFFQYDISEEVLNLLMSKPSLGIDTEATGLHYHRDTLCMVQICDNDGYVCLIHFPMNIYNQSPNLKKLLGNRNIMKIFHYAQFDVTMIFRYLRVMCLNVGCTRTMSKIGRSFSDRHGLKTLCRDILGIELNKTQQSTYWGAEHITEAQLSYAAGDVIHLHNIYAYLEKMLIRKGQWHFAQKAFEVIPTLADFNANHLDLLKILSYDD